MKGMTPEEWDKKQAEMKRRIERSLRENPGYGDHLAEQFEAFLRESADLVIPADQTDAVPPEVWEKLMSEKIQELKRREWKARWKRRLIWLALGTALALWVGLIAFGTGLAIKWLTKMN